MDSLKIRMNYYGGANQEDRMVADKLRSLKTALHYSYQGCPTIELNGNQFKALINPNKLKSDYDYKMISIPYEDICLNTNKVTSTGIAAGSTFKWLQNNTEWIVFLQYLEEIAYFRADIYRCRFAIEVNGNRYPIYVRGPVETVTRWNLKNGIEWNDLNYSLRIFITKNEETLEFFHRFTKVKIDGLNYAVETVDSISTEGILDIYLREDYTNFIEDEVVDIEKVTTSIKGDNEIYPYDIKSYTIDDMGGVWKVNSQNIKILQQNETSVTIEVLTGKHGEFELSYEKENEVISLPIKILSL